MNINTTDIYAQVSSLLDANDHQVAIGVIDCEVGNLRNSQARPMLR